MKKFLSVIALILASAIPVICQSSTTVTGTVIDSNGNPYANGTVSAFLILSVGQPVPPGAIQSSGPYPISATGTFSFSIASPYTYTFSLCAMPVNLGPTVNPTPKQICFSTPPISISGSSQSITNSLGTVAIIGPAANAGNPCTLTPYSVQINSPSNKFECSNITVDALTQNNLLIPGNGVFGGPVPWIDLQSTPYYARLLNASSNPSTTGTSSGTSLVVASNTGWQANDGLVVSKAGNATSQSTPSAPTVTPLGVTGSSTTGYECVGADALEGLTAASVAGTTTTDPLFFGEVPIGISSISRSSNVVSVTTSANMPVSSGTYHAMIWNVTWPSGVYNGVEAITVTSATTFTYSQTGTNETGTLTSGKSLVWLSNAFIIASITRTNSSNMVITTDVNHDIIAGTSQYPMVVNVSGVTPLDMDGTFRVVSVTSNTITVATGFYYSGTETGTLNYGNSGGGGFAWNEMGIYAFESNLVACPALSGTTTHYYIYAKYSGGSSYGLVGGTVPGQTTWRDWGTFLNGPGSGVINVGYTPPPAAAVPAIAPSSAQNQEYVGTVTGIAGTTFTVTPTIPTNVSGQAVYHDQSIAIETASTAACASGGGIVYFSGPAGISNPSGYVVNAPFNLTSNSSCRNLRWYGGAPLTLNDTLTDNIPGGFTLRAFSYGVTGSGTAVQAWPISGLGNPLINSWWNSGSFLEFNQLFMDGISIQASGNGQIGIESGGEYSTFENIYTTSQGTSSALDIHGPFATYISKITFAGFPIYAFTSIGGQTPNGMPMMGPLIPNVEMDNNGGSIIMYGLNSGSGKGIELYSLNLGLTEYESEFDNLGPLQAPYTPAVWTYGNVTTQGIGIRNITQDSIAEPCFSGFGSAIVNLTIDTCLVSGGPDIGGDSNRTLNILREPSATLLGQNQQVVRLNANNSVNAGPYGATALQSETLWNKPFALPGAINLPLFWDTQQVSGVSASASGSGTWPAGTYNMCVLGVGWNGGDSDEGPTSCASVTVNGSQGIETAWTCLSTVAGYDIFWNGQKQNSSAIPPGTCSETYTAEGFNGSQPGLSGTGLPLIDQNQVATPLVRANLNWPITIYSAAGTPVPTCNAAAKGETATVSDATSPTYMGIYSSGGAITVQIICSYNGSSYSWLTH